MKNIVKGFNNFVNEHMFSKKPVDQESKFVIPGQNRTGDLYADINALIDDKYTDVNYEEVAKVLANILKGVEAQADREKYSR